VGQARGSVGRRQDERTRRLASHRCTTTDPAVGVQRPLRRPAPEPIRFLRSPADRSHDEQEPRRAACAERTLACVAGDGRRVAGSSYVAVAQAAKNPPKKPVQASKITTVRPKTARGRPLSGPVGPAGAVGPVWRCRSHRPRRSLPAPPAPPGVAAAATSGTVALRARSTGSVAAPHGASTDVPLSSNSWTQGRG